MAVRDLEAYLRERAVQWDPTLDISPGSPFDTQVVQPLMRRLGTDPFTVDLITFLDARLKQAFPELATRSGDSVTDLLMKPAALLWDPIVRETTRVKRNLSFKDPATLTLEEAEALGANLFAERTTGEYARGQIRVFFSQPQNITVSSVNYATSRGGLRFFPTSVQTIRTEEMALNQAGDGTYYFDINMRAEEPGEDYNIGIGEMSNIANVEAAVRVTNLKRFRWGTPEQSAEEFIDSAQRQLTERSLVTLRGAAAQLTRAFSELRRMNVVGMGDPEMNRDIIMGGGLGEVLISGHGGMTVDDTSHQAATRRFAIDPLIDTDISFFSSVGSSSATISGFVLTLVDAAADVAANPIQDFDVLRVIDDQTLEISEQLLAYNRTDLRWALRKKELTISKIPGGILFPTSPAGTLTIEDGTIHVGGATDIYISGTEFQEATLVLDNVTDETVELSGTDARLTTDGVELYDFVLGTDYSINDATYRLLERAQRRSLTLQLVTGGPGHDPDNLGVYRVVRAVQALGAPAKLQVEPILASLDSPIPYRWRLFDEVNITLTDPKETRTSGSDLSTVQNSTQVTTGSGTDFTELGVSQDDVLRILNGPDAGDYVIDSVITNTILRLDTVIRNTASNLQYTIFRKNAAGGISLPLIRITQIDLLDSSLQPLGSTIPYAKPIDIQSRAFQNPGRGVKHTLSDVQLGIISQVAAGGSFSGIAGHALAIRVHLPDGSFADQSCAFGSDPTLSQAISLINSAVYLACGVSDAVFEFEAGSRFAIRPVKAGLELRGDDEALTSLFGNGEPRTTADIRSDTVISSGGWEGLSPAVDYNSGLDIAQAISGNQIGFYTAPYSGPSSSTGGTYTGDVVTASQALIIRDVTVDTNEKTKQFAPEENVRLQVGSRSLGSARCYFLEPTTIEFGEDSIFYAELTTGLVRFMPDPTLNYQIIPPLPGNSKSNDGESTQYGNIFSAASQNFLRSGVTPGDILVIDYLPLRGSKVHATATITDLAAKPSALPPEPAKYLTFSINDGPNLTVTFIRDDTSLSEGEVTKEGVIEQINAKAGMEIAAITAADKIEFVADALITIKKEGTANPVLLENVDDTGQSFSTQDCSNQSPHALATGEGYRIDAVDITELEVSPNFDISLPYPATITRQGFRIYRRGVQRISTTQMALQKAEAGLYYADVELVSEGCGDLWNIAADIQLKAEGYVSDGYYLETEDENLSFSMLEVPKLVTSKSILENGVDDDPNNITQIAGQNLQIRYERSQLVQDAQAYVNAQTERVTGESILIRHLIPNYVRFDLFYVGGSREDIVIPLLERYIRDLRPINPLESSRVQDIVNRAGATSLTNPVALISVIHNLDRIIWASRSENYVTAGRLSAFFPDLLNVVRSVG
jgi:hypothetical protein